MQQIYKELLLGCLNASNEEITFQNLLKCAQKERQEQLKCHFAVDH
jgi:hypothetical protein